MSMKFIVTELHEAMIWWFEEYLSLEHQYKLILGQLILNTTQLSLWNIYACKLQHFCCWDDQWLHNNSKPWKFMSLIISAARLGFHSSRTLYCISGRLLFNYPLTWHSVPEELTPQFHCCERLKEVTYRSKKNTCYLFYFSVSLLTRSQPITILWYRSACVANFMEFWNL